MQFARSHLPLGFFAGLCLAVTWLAAGLAIVELRNTETATWSANARSTSVMIAAYVEKTLTVSELVLQAMIDRLHADGVDDEAEYRSEAGSRAYFDFLRRRIENLDQVDVATFIAADGRILNFSRSFPPPVIDLSDRDYFKAQAGPDAPPISLGASVRNRGTGRWTFYLARRVTSTAGDLLGVVIVGVEAEYLDRYFRQAVRAPGMGISFLRNDGVLLAATFGTDRLGEKLRLDPRVLSALGEADPILLDTPSPARADAPARRLVAPRALNAFPGFVVISIPEAAVLARWHRTTLWILSAAGLTSLLIVVVAVRMARATRRARRLAFELRDKETLAVALNAPATLAALVDASGRFVYRNDAFREMFGVRDTLDGVFPPEVACEAAGLAPGAKSIEVEFVASVADARNRAFRFWISPLAVDAAHSGAVLVGHDETRRRLAETALVQSAKLISLGEIATNVAHELNQPLNVIKMAVQSARYEVDEALSGRAEPGVPSTSRDLLRFIDGKLERIEGQVDRAGATITHMRIFGRVPEEEAAVFDAREACHGALDLVRGRLSELGVDVIEEIGPVPLPVRGHRTKLEQVLLNLLNNAQQALLGGARRTDARIEISARREACGRIVIQVADNGPGISEQVQARLFEPFFTTKPEGTGTGVGLTISRTIVEDMGGSLSLAPAGPGATFRIELPAGPAEGS